MFDVDQKAIFRPLPKKMRTDLAIHVHLDTLHKVSFFEVSNELDTEYGSNKRALSCSAGLHKRSKFNQKESRWSQTVTCTATELYSCSILMKISVKIIRIPQLITME